MKTLYQRIVAITFLVMIVSIGVAFLISNVYYQYHLKPIDGELLPLLRKKGLPKEIINLVRSIIKGLISYQNENVKHSQTFTDLEVEFVIEQTSILMKLFAKIEKIEKES